MTRKALQEHLLMLKATFWVAPLENLLYIVLLILLDSKRDYLLSPVFLLLVFCTLETYLLARFLGMCKLQKAAIWNPLLGPLLLWLSPTSWNEFIVWGIIAETSALLLLIIYKAILRLRGRKCSSCPMKGSDSAHCATCKLYSCTTV